MKATAIAPSNIAFTKYWGRKDEILRLPIHGSISMTLSNLLTTTTVEFSEKYKTDQIIINKGIQEVDEAERVIKHLDRIRNMAKINLKAKMVSNNNFPSGTGLASSASGFAALTVAGAEAAGLNLSEIELSILARQGSGSACRSIPSGFVEWLDGNTSKSSYAIQIFPPDYWGIVDVVAIISKEKKEVSSSTGHQAANTSPFFQIRVSKMTEKNKLIKKMIKERSFKKFGELIEQEALEFHAITLTQNPPLIYWMPNTVLLMKAVRKWRKQGLSVYFTLDTGQDIHLICQKKDAKEVSRKALSVSEVQKTIINYPSRGAHLINKNLF